MFISIQKKSGTIPNISPLEQIFIEVSSTLAEHVSLTGKQNIPWGILSDNVGIIHNVK